MPHFCGMDLLQKWESANGISATTALDLVCAHARHTLTSKVAARLRLIVSGAEKPDAHNLQKLSAALARCPKIGAKAEKPAGAQAEEGTETGTLAPQPPLTSAKAKRLHKEQAYHHAMMVSASTDQERAEHAERVLQLSKQLDIEYDRLRSGKEEEQSTPAASQASDNYATLKRLNSLRARIAKLRNKLIPKAVGKRLADLEAELASKQAEKERLENAIA